MRKQRADFFVRPSAAIAGVLVTGVGLVLALVTYSFLALKDERYADAIRPFDLGRMTLARRIGQMVVVGPLMTTGLVHPLLSFRAH